MRRVTRENHLEDFLIFNGGLGGLYCSLASEEAECAIQTGTAHLFVFAPFHGEQYKY